MTSRDRQLRIAFRSLAVSATLASMPLAAQETGYIGSAACWECHPSQFEAQSKSAHARALRKAQPTDPGPGAKAQWAFGAGAKAITWVSQKGEDAIVEHGRTYYTATKSLGITPGHETSADRVYRTFDPVATALLCFRCHSTGPISLAAGSRVEPAEAGVRCEACHGPGRAHAESSGGAAIQNPMRLSAVQINVLCGSCHRQASDLDDDRDWSNPWNVRHQPSYLHRAACFRNSGGALSCLTCHDPHGSLQTAAPAYNRKCGSCHPKPAHATAVAGRSCIGCHMPRVAVTANLTFTNHWIGVYDSTGPRLIPSRRVVKGVQPAPAIDDTSGMIVPADPSTLIPLYERAAAQNAPRAESNLGLFLLQIGRRAEAEANLRRAIEWDQRSNDPAIDADREGLALALDALGKRNEAVEEFKRAAEGKTPAVTARASVKLAELDPEHAETYYRNALAAEEKGSGSRSTRVAVVLHAYAQELRVRKRDAEAQPLLRRALAIQQAAPQSDPRVTIDVLNALGNLLEGRGQLDEAEKLVRSAMSLAEAKFGPESPQLATSCTYLADILWNRKRLREAGLLFRRAIAIDASIYGPDRPETAADIANLGMLMKEAGQQADGEALLRQALAIYESALGPGSEEAKFVRDRLAR